jgi:hypothetical protein
MREDYAIILRALRKYTDNPIRLKKINRRIPIYLSLPFSEHKMFATYGPEKAMDVVRKILGKVELPSGATVVVSHDGGSNFGGWEHGKLVALIRKKEKTAAEKEELSHRLERMGEIRVSVRE